MKLIKKFGFVCLVSGWLGVSAQEGEFRLGFQVNPGLSWMNSDKLSVSKVGSNMTLGLGMQAEFGVSDHLSAVTGVGLAFNRGGTLRHETGGNFFPESRLSNDALNEGQKPLPDGTKLRYHLQYVQLPIGLKWHAQVNADFNAWLEAPVVTWGYALQRRGSIDAGDIEAKKENIKKDVNAFNLSLGFGAGIERLYNDNTALIIGIAYHRGVFDVTSDAAHTATPNPDDNPFLPGDDYIEHKENANAFIGALVIRLGILFR